MSVKTLLIKDFYGGIAPSEKGGAKGAFFFGQGLSIFDEPSQATALRALSKDSGANVTGLIKWIVPGTPYNTNTYFYDENGVIYKRTSGGTWSALQTTATSSGQGFEVLNDYLYYARNGDIGRYGSLTGVPTFDDTWGTVTMSQTFNNTSTTGFGPIKAFKEGFAFGNGNDLAWYDNSTLDQDRIVLPQGFNIRTLEVIDEFLVIGAWRGTTVSASEQGYLFFWDGSAVTFNFFVEIQEGGVNATLNSKNRLLSALGSSGYLYLNYAPFNKVERIPKLDSDEYVEIFPGAMTNWKGMAHIGVSGNTDSTTVEQGVYQYGSLQDGFPEVLNFAYPISTGTTTGTGVRIGAVKGIGDTLFVAWKDASTYGVDIINSSATFQTTATYEALIFDDGRPHVQKRAMTLKATHKALAASQSVQLGYKVDRAANYTTGTANSTVGSTVTRLPIPASDARFYEFQAEVLLASGGSDAPTILSVALEYDDLSDERGGF